MNKHKHNSERVSYQLEERPKLQKRKIETVSRKREREKKNDELCERAKKKKESKQYELPHVK